MKYCNKEFANSSWRENRCNSGLPVLCRSVWCSSSGHARLHAWRHPPVWARSSYGSPLPGSSSHGHEAPRHVPSWTLLTQQSSHHIRFEVNTFLTSLRFFQPSAEHRAVRPVVVKTNIICYDTWTFNRTCLFESNQTPHVSDSYSVV